MLGIQEANKRDLQQVEEAIEKGILQVPDPKKHPEEVRAGNQCSFCPDSDQSGDFMRRHAEVLERSKDRHGFLGLYGGALLIPRHSPLAHHGEGRVLLEHLYLGYLLEKGPVIIPGTHTPCGMARLHDLSVRDTFALLCDAKDAIRDFIIKRGKATLRYIEEEAKLVAEYGPEPKLDLLALKARLELSEVQSIRLVKRIMPLEEAAKKPVPKLIPHFHIDYGKLGGEPKKELRHFNRHAWANAEQIRLGAAAYPRIRAVG